MQNKTGIATICSAVIIFNLSSCKYPDGPSISLKTKKSRLVGRWEVKEMFGEKVDSDYEVILEFEKDGDMKFGYIYDNYGYYYFGEWEWDNDKADLEIDFYDEPYTFEIQRLTNKELILESDDGDWEAEKIKD
ncbi:hypothetical protein GYB22_10950 [bacterium]|nr:hypothetical protein [bacterium]